MNIFCPKCGKKSVGVGKFCSYCGANLKSTGLNTKPKPKQAQTANSSFTPFSRPLNNGTQPEYDKEDGVNVQFFDSSMIQGLDVEYDETPSVKPITLAEMKSSFVPSPVREKSTQTLSKEEFMQQWQKEAGNSKPLDD